MNRTRVAGVMSASTALALMSTVPASAHTSSGGGTSPQLRYGPAITRHIAFQDLVVKELDALQAKATALHVRTAAIPSATVLRGTERAQAIRSYKKAVRLSAFLERLTGLTPVQAAQIDAIQAQLDIAAARLKALLANRPAAEPVTVVQTDRVVTVADTRLDADDDADDRDGRCDGDHDGIRSTSFRDGWGDRDGRDRWRHHR